MVMIMVLPLLTWCPIFLKAVLIKWRVSLPNMTCVQLDMLTFKVYADSLKQLTVDRLSSGSTPTSVDYAGFSGFILHYLPSRKADIAIHATTLTGMDFALVRMGSKFRSNNSYRQAQRSKRRLELHHYPIMEVDSELASGPASLLCSPDDVRTGFVLDGSAFFMDRTGFFETKKIYTDAPLGKLLGSPP